MILVEVVDFFSIFALHRIKLEDRRQKTEEKITMNFKFENLTI
jgi:hypothetical protein